MACTVNTSALISIDDLLNYMGLSPQSLLIDAFTIYAVGTGGALTGTIQVDTFNNRVQIVIAGGDDAGTHNFALATYTTLGTLKTGIEAAIDAEIVLLTHSSQLTADLPELAATNCLGTSNVVTVQVRNTCRMADAINFASELVEMVVGRRFKLPVLHYIEQVRASEEGIFTTKHWPIRNIRRITSNIVEAIRLSNSTTDASSIVVTVLQEEIYLSIYGGTNDDLDIVNFSTQPTVADVADDINGIGMGWLAEIPSSPVNVENTYSRWFVTLPATEVKPGSYVSLYVATDLITGYTSEDYDGGIVNLGRSYANRLLYIEYTAGYASSEIPADVLGVIRQIAREFYESSERDASLKSEKLGDYAYEVSDQEQSDMTSRIAEQLSHHVVPIG